MRQITYDGVVTALLDTIPEVRNVYDSELRWWGKDPPPPDPYTVFGFALRPVLTHLARTEADEGVLKRVFGFFEEMAGSEDLEVVNLLQVSELEFLVTNPDLLSRAWKYMGERTKALTRETAKTWNSHQNLPAEE